VLIGDETKIRRMAADAVWTSCFAERKSSRRISLRWSA